MFLDAGNMREVREYIFGGIRLGIEVTVGAGSFNSIFCLSGVQYSFLKTVHFGPSGHRRQLPR